MKRELKQKTEAIINTKVEITLTWRMDKLRYQWEDVSKEAKTKSRVTK